MTARFLAAMTIMVMSGCTSRPATVDAGSSVVENAEDAAIEAAPPAAASPVFDVLRHATSVELFRVHGSSGLPVHDDAGNGVLDRDYPIEARGMAVDPKAAAEALLRHVAPPHSPVGMCFNPGHAMRVSDGVRTVDYVVCFECKQVISYENGTELQMNPISGTADDFEAIFAASHVAKVPRRPGPGPARF